MRPAWRSPRLTYDLSAANTGTVAVPVIPHALMQTNGNGSPLPFTFYESPPSGGVYSMSLRHGGKFVHLVRQWQCDHHRLATNKQRGGYCQYPGKLAASREAVYT